MKKWLTITVVLLACCGVSGANPADTLKKDTSYWKSGCLLGTNFTQVALSNWSAGGQNSISGTGIISLFSRYAKRRMRWDTDLDLGYGLIKQGTNRLWAKSDDKIDFSSKFGHRAFNSWFYAASLSFKSQFAPGFDDPYKPDSIRKVISNFMAPGYIMLALGLDYKPNDNFNVFVSPATGKMTLVENQTLADVGAFGVEAAEKDANGVIIQGTGKRRRLEMGGSVKSMFKARLMENVNMVLKLELFSNYLNNPQNIDVNSELLVSMKVNKFLSVTLNVLLLYDDDISIARDTNGDGVTDKNGPITQVKEVLGVGFNYRF